MARRVPHVARYRLGFRGVSLAFHRVWPIVSVEELAMWMILSRTGFLSVVVPRNQKTGEIEHDRLMVRARKREHLELLRSQHTVLTGVRILRSPDHADYRWRILVPRSDFADVVREIVERLDVTNVKSDGHAHEAETGRDFVSALHACHALFARLQDLEDGEPDE